MSQQPQNRENGTAGILVGLTPGRAALSLPATVASVVILCCSMAAASGAAYGNAESARWALLIGVEGYDKAPSLRYTTNDVAQIANTLTERGGFTRDNILEMVDQAPDEQLRPRRANIMSRLPEWLAKPGPNDEVIVYFSGHGFRDQADKMYLAPLDCDPQDPAATGVAVEWLREELMRCRASFKLLVLDACHAGSEKGDAPPMGVTAKDLGEPFRQVAGVVTLASSTGEEMSQLWHEKRQSLFSYWLNQGLKGHADDNGDSQIDVDELNKYVHRNVSNTAQALFSRAQTPVRIVRSGTPGVPVVLRLEPLTLKQVLADMAEQLAYSLQERKLNKVGVLEFTNDTKIGELLGADFGVLGRYCAAELQDRLTRLAGDKYTVVNQRRLQAALTAQQMDISKLGSPAALKELSARAGGVPVIALGTLRSRAGRVVNLQCTLIQTAEDAIAGVAGGTAFLNESEWAMLGRSVEVQHGDRPAPGSEVPNRDVATEFIARLDQRATEPHPMSAPPSQFEVYLRVNGQRRRPTFKGNDMFVPVRAGEVYELCVDNHTGQIAMMRLLVDGLNTLPQRAVDAKGIKTLLVAPRVNLDDARAWVLDPQQAKRFVVRGFVTETGPQGKLNEFQVVNADDSLAARQQFTDQIGIITAAFYSASAVRAGPFGTTFGNELDEDLSERNDMRVGNLLSVIHIRYVDSDTLSQ